MKRLALTLFLSATALPALAQDDHPLMGTIWLVAENRPINRDELLDRMQAVPYVLLGETHDNPAHHTLQTILTRDYLQQKPAAILAFEMIDSGQTAKLRQVMATNPTDASILGPALQWEKNGWPDWSLYAPIAQAALDHRAKINPANLTRPQVRGVARGEPVDDVPPIRPLSQWDQADLNQDITADHCHLLPDSMIPGMARVQQARDAVMAKALENGPAILIAGSGHVRVDRGVPTYLPQGKSLSIAFIEVEEGENTPTAYAASYRRATLPFDAVWFTSKQPRADQCQALENKLKAPP